MSQPPETIYLFLNEGGFDWDALCGYVYAADMPADDEEDIEYTRSPRVRYHTADGWSYAAYGDIDRIEVDGQVWRVNGA